MQSFVLGHKTLGIPVDILKLGFTAFNTLTRELWKLGQDTSLMEPDLGFGEMCSDYLGKSSCTFASADKAEVVRTWYEVEDWVRALWLACSELCLWNSQSLTSLKQGSANEPLPVHLERMSSESGGSWNITRERMKGSKLPNNSQMKKQITKLTHSVEENCIKHPEDFVLWLIATSENCWLYKSWST